MSAFLPIDYNDDKADNFQQHKSDEESNSNTDEEEERRKTKMVSVVLCIDCRLRNGDNECLWLKVAEDGVDNCDNEKGK